MRIGQGTIQKKIKPFISVDVGGGSRRNWKINIVAATPAPLLNNPHAQEQVEAGDNQLRNEDKLLAMSIIVISLPALAAAEKIFDVPEKRRLALGKDKVNHQHLTFAYEPHRLEAALGQLVAFLQASHLAIGRTELRKAHLRDVLWSLANYFALVATADMSSGVH